MYSKESNSRFDWKDVVSKVIFLIIFVLLMLWLFPKVPNMTAFYSGVFRENMSYMKDAAKSYYTNERLPKNIGDSQEITLQEMINKSLILPFVDKDGVPCDTRASYVQVTKQQSEYSLKVNLVCKSERNYIIEPIGCTTVCENCGVKPVVEPAVEKPVSYNPGNNNNNNNNNNVKPVPKPDPVNPVITKYTVTFNPNGGVLSSASSQVVNDGSKISKPSNPTRSGYTFTGWYKESTIYNFDTAVRSNFGLVAGWSYNNPSTPTYEYKNCEWGYTNEYGYTNVTRDVSYFYYLPHVLKEYQTTSYVTKAGTYSYTLNLKDMPRRAYNPGVGGQFDNYGGVNMNPTLSLRGRSYFDSGDYREYLNDRDKDISMIGGNTTYNVYPSSIQEFKNSSLTSNNFSFSVSEPYYSNNTWKEDITVNVRNLNNISPYWASNINSYVYFVPLKFNFNYYNYDGREEKIEGTHEGYAQMPGNRVSYERNVKMHCQIQQWN
ncbi:MAG: InlB B-repeat-containing protein [Bacilli bacterium]